MHEITRINKGECLYLTLGTEIDAYACVRTQTLANTHKQPLVVCIRYVHVYIQPAAHLQEARTEHWEKNTVFLLLYDSSRTFTP